jgi:glycosyltransferase involved in cell wall biosynthesis
MTMKTKVSFIIPALNEERRIGNLIDSINKLEKDWNCEIIVADGNSSDKTRIIAEKLGAIVIKDNEDAPKTIANGRNTGASLASGELFIFCDADTLIKEPENFLTTVFSVFEDQEIVGGAPSISIFPDESTRKDKIFHWLYNTIIRFSFIINMPLCGGQCQIVRASAFREINGYDENIVHTEDSELFRRLGKTGRLHFFHHLIVYESPRRYRYYGYVSLLIKALRSLTYQKIFKKNIFKEWTRVEYN